MLPIYRAAYRVCCPQNLPHYPREVDRALIIRAAAEGQTEIAACLFCTVSCTVIFRPFHSWVDLAMSSPIFLGDKPRGPTLGAREEVAPTSPPTTRNLMILISLGSNLGGILQFSSYA